MHHAGMYTAVLTAVLGCGALAIAQREPAQRVPPPCCTVTHVDQGQHVATARYGGRQFKFAVPCARSHQEVKVGQHIWANLRTREVSLDGRSGCSRIVGEIRSSGSGSNVAGGWNQQSQASAASAATATGGAGGISLADVDTGGMGSAHCGSGETACCEPVAGKTTDGRPYRGCEWVCVKDRNQCDGIPGPQTPGGDGSGSGSGSGGVVGGGPTTQGGPTVSGGLAAPVDGIRAGVNTASPLDGVRTPVGPIDGITASITPSAPVDGAAPTDGVRAGTTSLAPVDGARTQVNLQPANEGPCCSITAINASTGVVTAKVKSSGQVFQFKAAGNLLNSLRVGQSVFANLRTREVSVDGGRACCGIVNTGAATGVVPARAVH